MNFLPLCEPRMSEQPKDWKFKRPHTAEDLVEIEDQVDQLGEKLREIRKILRESNLPHLVLKTGTLRFLLKRCRALAKKYVGEAGKFADEEAEAITRRNARARQADIKSGSKGSGKNKR